MSTDSDGEVDFLEIKESQCHAGSRSQGIQVREHKRWGRPKLWRTKREKESPTIDLTCYSAGQRDVKAKR